MNINNAFPSKYLRSADIAEGDDLIVTIRSVEMESIEQDDNYEEKPIVFFHETNKGLLLNKTNATTIAHLHGPETDGWVGQKIALFATEVDFKGKQTLAIRVRLRAPLRNGKRNGNTPKMRQDSPGYTEEPEEVSEPNQEYLALVRSVKAVPFAEAEAAWQPIAFRLKTKADIVKIISLTHPEAQALAVKPLRELVDAIADPQGAKR